MRDLVGRALAHRAGDHAGLAEPAAAGAAPEHLDVEPVVHDLGERHELAASGRASRPGRRSVRFSTTAGRGGVDRHGGLEPAVGQVAGLVQRRDVDALDPGQRAQDVEALGPTAGDPRGDDLGDLADDLLAVAEHDEVEEVGERLGVVGAVAAGADERVARRCGRPPAPARRPGRCS